MSYSMSPPPQKPAPRSYSPYQESSGSPTSSAPYGPPPPKRQRTSPDPQSPPNGTPGWIHPPPNQVNANSYGNPYAPMNSAVQSPYATTPTYGQSPQQSSFNTPQPYPYQHSPWQSQSNTPAPTSRQMSPPSQPSRDMPPPPRPNRDEREEKVGVEEIGDSLFGSGINLKDEENYLHAMYNNRHHQYNAQDSQSFSTNQNTSFGSSTMSANNSFNKLTQSTSFGSQEAFAGTLGEVRSEETIEVEQRKKREAAARNQAERRQHHLNNQFLQCNNVRKRVDTLAREQGVMVNIQGVWLRTPEDQLKTTTMVNGDKKEGIVAVKEETKQPESFVNQNTPFEHMLSLISLAAGERIRGLMDEAFALSRARKYGDHGRVVPPEFADIAIGEGKANEEDVVPESITDSQWDKVASKEATSSGDVDTTENANGERSKSSTPQPQHTISFAGLLNDRLRALEDRDRLAEKDRLKRREARKRKASEMANSSATPPPESSSAPDVAADVPKLTKKEQARQQKEKNSSTEAQLHNTTNQTAAMMALGKKGRRYDWMTGGAASMPTNRFAKPSTSGNASGTATPVKLETSSGPVTPGVGGVPMVKSGSAQSREVKVPEWGDWRENAKGGMEMRDWVLVLERDGREKVALVRALHKLEQ